MRRWLFFLLVLIPFWPLPDDDKTQPTMSPLVASVLAADGQWVWRGPAPGPVCAVAGQEIVTSDGHLVELMSLLSPHPELQRISSQEWCRREKLAAAAYSVLRKDTALIPEGRPFCDLSKLQEDVNEAATFLFRACIMEMNAQDLIEGTYSGGFTVRPAVVPP